MRVYSPLTHLFLLPDYQLFELGCGCNTITRGLARATEMLG
jgi:hypothetical protein